jgi:hypothetical protein
MRNRPTIQLYSDDAPRRHRGSSRPGVAVGLSATVLVGAVAYAATEVGQPTSWMAQALFAIVTAAFAVLAARRWLLSRGRGWNTGRSQAFNAGRGDRSGM